MRGMEGRGILCLSGVELYQKLDDMGGELEKRIKDDPVISISGH